LARSSSPAPAPAPSSAFSSPPGGAGGRGYALEGGNQLEHMNLGARVLEQLREMPQSLGMPQPRLATAISKRPMVALAPKPVGCAISHRRSWRV
jgi:hypothetical protein